MSQAGLARIAAGNLPPSVPTRFDGNVNFAVPLANRLKILTANSTVIFEGSANILTLDFNPLNIAFGSTLPNRTIGGFNIFLGDDAGEGLTSGTYNIGIGGSTFLGLIAPVTGTGNIAIGQAAMPSGGAGNFNVGIGEFTFENLNNGDYNTGIGTNSLLRLFNGSLNTALGRRSLWNIVDGNNNIGIGVESGGNYTNIESSNIVIGNEGVVGENNTIRIGTQGIAVGQQNRTFMAGILGNSVTGDFVNIDASGQLGVISGSTGVGQSITGNSGGARPPLLGNWNIITANSTPKFVGAGSTLTLDFNLTTNLVLGSALPLLTSGLRNSGVGSNVMAVLTTATNNVAMGYNALTLTTSGSSNVAIGFAAGTTLTTGSNNTLVGVSAGANISTSANSTAIGSGALSTFSTGAANVGLNTAIGVNALVQLQTGTNNIAVGNSAGGVYTTSESSNIMIGNQGVIAESNVMRLGTQGSGAGQQLQTHIAGVINTVSGRVVKTTVPGAYPYTTLTTDYVILVDTSAARTINLVATPVTGTTYRIKDNVGSAAAFNITITPAAGTIDGAASLVISSNWGSLDLVYQGTSWRAF